MKKVVSEKQWLENICYNCDLKGYCELRDKEQYCEWYKRIEKDLEIFEILEKIALGIATEEDLATARKHYEKEVKQLLEKSYEGYTIIQYPQENNNDK